MAIDKGAVRFTVHSLQRAIMYGVSTSDLLRAWFDSHLVELKLKEREYKFKKYGLQSLDDFYTLDHKTDLLFTCNKSGPLTTIITVTNKRVADRDWSKNEKKY